MIALNALIPVTCTTWAKIVNNDAPGWGVRYPTPEDFGFSHADLYGFAIIVGIPILMGAVVLVIILSGKNPRRGHRRK